MALNWQAIIPLLVSHEPFIGKFLNIVAWYNVFKLSRQVELIASGNNIEEWPDMAHD